MRTSIFCHIVSDSRVGPTNEVNSNRANYPLQIRIGILRSSLGIVRSVPIHLWRRLIGLLLAVFGHLPIPPAAHPGLVGFNV
jgi:hypothetical protein